MFLIYLFAHSAKVNILMFVEYLCFLLYIFSVLQRRYFSCLKTLFIHYKCKIIQFKNKFYTMKSNLCTSFRFYQYKLFM